MSFYSEVAFPYVVGVEAGFTNDPRDDGNWTGGRAGHGTLKGTKFGISAAAYPNLDIENLTVEQAEQIAKSDYWDVLKGDYLPPGIALSLFDHAYNTGVHHAAVLLQQTMGDVTADGVLGAQTLIKLKDHDTKLLIQGFALARIADYVKDRGWAVDGAGWTTRAINTAHKAAQV